MSAEPASRTSALLDSYGFDLDEFQRRAADALDAGRSVLVSAPTGAGKTVVAEYAVAAALDRGLRAFYTTPIKALSNQKYGDLRARHGVSSVGLLTGDNSIEGDAPVVVMTTEVLRNMIYAGRSLDDLAVVVLDEVHYLQDSFRGPVWEEVIVHLPEHVQLVCLSATVSNAHDIGEWLSTVRGPTDVVVEEHRPVELANTYLVGDKSSDRLHLIDTLIDGRPNPEGERFDVDSGDNRDRHRRGGRGGRPRRRWYTPNRLDVLDVLEADSLLPAIVFIFSRAGCDDAVRACLDAGVRLTAPEERGEIRRIAEEHLTSLTDADLDALDADRWMAGLEAGLAAHHAGHVPPFKEAVEACFAAGLVKVVFATETLALGVNMPARAVVIEKMTKYNGERREFLTPAQYTQLTGRAGRRGIDTHGTAVVLWSPFISFGQIAGLAASRSFVLRSAFRPTYNMAANLVRRHDHDAARRLLNQSLAQYQADRAVVVLERRLRGRQQALDAAEADATCELGDVAELRDLVHASSPRRVRRQQIEHSLAALRPGDVVATADEPRVAVLSLAFRKGGAIRAKVVTPDRHVQVLGIGDFDRPPRRLATLELPVPYLPEDSDFRREVAARLGSFVAGDTAGAGDSGPQEIDHPVAACPDVDTHLRALDRVGRLRREVADLTHRIESQTGTIGLQFEQVLSLLGDWGYVDGWSLTERGELLSGVYHEVDLVVAEAIASGCFDGLDAPELAAVASVLVYEHRAPGPAPAPSFPSSKIRAAADVIDQLARRLQLDEQSLGLPLSRSTDPGFCDLAHEWCAGAGLAALLDRGALELTGGDFVRTIRQLVDLVRQIGQLAPDPATRATARRATGALERGVVSASAALAAAGDDDEGRADEGPDEGPDDSDDNPNETAGADRQG